MYINFVTFNYSGGGNNNLFHLHKEAIKKKINSNFICLSKVEIRNKSYFFKIITYFLSILKCMIFFLKFNFSTKKNEFIIFSDPLICFISILIPKKKRIFYAQSDDFNLHIIQDGHPKIFILIHKLIVKINNVYNYKIVLANSSYIQSVYLKFHKVVKIVYPITNVPIQFVNTSYLYKKKILNKKKLTVGTIGRRHKRKGLDDFIYLSKMFKYKFEFIILSDEITSKYKNIKTHNPKNKYDFFKSFSSFDIFISTSSFEGFGLPILEALKLGIPVIAMKNGSINELEYKETVKIYKDPKDAYKLLKAIHEDRQILFTRQNSTLKNSKRFTEAISFQSLYGSLLS